MGSRPRGIPRTRAKGRRHQAPRERAPAAEGAAIRPPATSTPWHVVGGIAQALGHCACRAGYSVAHTGAHQMLTELRAARADNSYDRRLLRFTAPDLLIIDDLGLRQLPHNEPLDLYEVVRQALRAQIARRHVEPGPG